MVRRTLIAVGMVGLVVMFAASTGVHAVGIAPNAPRIAATADCIANAGMIVADFRKVTEYRLGTLATAVV